MKRTIKDKDKVFLIYYLNISKMSIELARAYIAEVDDTLHKNFDETVKTLVIPVSECNTHIEVFNINKITDEESLSRFNKVVNTLEEIYNN